MGLDLSSGDTAACDKYDHAPAHGEDRSGRDRSKPLANSSRAEPDGDGDGECKPLL